MKKIVAIFLSILFGFSIFSCSDGDANIEERFSKLNAYAQSSNSIITWSDEIRDSSREVIYNLKVLADKKIVLEGETIYPYNDGINIEKTFVMEFVFGSEKNNTLTFSIRFETIMRKLKDQYTYYSYVLDEDIIVDNDATFDTKNYTSCCYYDSLYSKNDSLIYTIPNGVLNRLAEDSFANINKYLNNQIGISLFT